MKKKQQKIRKSENLNSLTKEEQTKMDEVERIEKKLTIPEEVINDF